MTPFSFRLAPLLLLALAPPPQEDAEPLPFRYDPRKVEVGRVFDYRHSNIDGTRASRVTVYWADPDRIEALKWNPGWREATLVVARMSWKTFSVDSFTTYKLGRDGSRRRLARLETKEGRAVAAGGALSCAIERYPWHSYDFDLTSLNLSLRFLEDPEEPLLFGILDAVQKPGGVALVFKGEVELAYEGDEPREGIPCRRYSLAGPGLEFRDGTVWVSRTERPCFVDFEIDLPDEPGMTTGKLTLLGTEERTPEEWEAFVKASVE